MDNMERIKTALDAIDYVSGGLRGYDKCQLALATDALKPLKGAVAILRKTENGFELVTADKTTTGRIDILNSVEDIMYEAPQHEKYEVWEPCPHCGAEHHCFSDNFTTTCECGKEILLCSMCNHTNDCDWREGKGCKMSHRFIDEVLMEEESVDDPID